MPRIEQRRREPTNDLLSNMVNEEVDGEGRFSTAELLAIIDQVLLAGHETTTNLIGNEMLVLLRDPALMARCRVCRSTAATWLCRCGPPLAGIPRCLSNPRVLTPRAPTCVST